MQDGATAHTARNSRQWLAESFGDRVISLKTDFPWSPHSPDLSFFSGVIWRIGSTVNHQQLYWNWRTQSSIMWINWETMLSSRDLWLGNSRRGLESAWTGRAATLSTCSDVLMTHPHSAESSALLIVLLQSILPHFHKNPTDVTTCVFVFFISSVLISVSLKSVCFSRIATFFKSLVFPQF